MEKANEMKINPKLLDLPEPARCITIALKTVSEAIKMSVLQQNIVALQAQPCKTELQKLNKEREIRRLERKYERMLNRNIDLIKRHQSDLLNTNPKH